MSPWRMRRISIVRAVVGDLHTIHAVRVRVRVGVSLAEVVVMSTSHFGHARAGPRHGCEVRKCAPDSHSQWS